MLSQLRPAVVATVLLTFVTGEAYPLVVTGVAKAMPEAAEGSVVRNAAGQVVGSSLIGQSFTQARYLHGRPSGAGANGYDASASSGSNYGPLNEDLAKRVKEQSEAVRAETGQKIVPEEAVTASGSGLDPDISPLYASLQAERIAKARGVSAADVKAIIASQTQGPALGFMGQPRVNVLKVNLALDAKFPAAQPPA
jgi:potassium-transporting ATPase KdpC subunit